MKAVIGAILLVMLVHAQQINIKTDRSTLPIGESTLLTISVSTAIPTYLKFYAYVNDSQWGAPATPKGNIFSYELIIPFPSSGKHKLQVALQKPFERDKTPFPVGKMISKDVVALSNVLFIDVTARPIRNPFTPKNATRFIGMEWEPWFTALNDRWNTGESVPIVGNYDSFNRDVIKQHAIWMIESGIDFIMVDWTNNLWEKNHWNERNANVQELCNATTVTLEVYESLKKDDIQTPKVVLLLGLNNGINSTMTAINEELDFIKTNYVDKYSKDIWIWYNSKPLVVILDCGNVHPSSPIPVNDKYFTIRWMATQLQVTHQEQLGYWSWMDGSERPVATKIPHTNIVEAVTPATGTFASLGWLGSDARGHRGGSTFIEQYKTVYETLPLFTIINQWNEFAGQEEGHGYGPNHDIYVDSYNVELNNDIEPTDMNECAYRGCGGWGFSLLNIQRAMIDTFRQIESGAKPNSTVLVIGSPLQKAIVNGNILNVTWNVIGKAATGYSIYLDDHLAADVQGSVQSFVLNVASLSKGLHTVKVVARGTTTPYEISFTRVDRPIKPISPSSSVLFRKL